MATRVNHNPRWRVKDDYGQAYLIQGCDEVQVRDFAERVLRLLVRSIVRAD